MLALVYILGWVIRGRNSTYIGAFEDYTGDATLKDAIRGRTPLLGKPAGKDLAFFTQPATIPERSTAMNPFSVRPLMSRMSERV